MGRWLRRLAAGVAAHGVLFGAVSLLPADAPLVGATVLFAFALPASLLALPFRRVLWRLGLMHAPGWFAWPTPAGFALVYAASVLSLLALATLVTRSGRREA
jgi:hypothetical protein